MKITQETRQVTGEGLQRSKNFSVEVGAHIMAVLSGLYKNPLDAIVREYLTNMFDAYVALGPYNVNEHPNPILHLPTAFEPYLEFKDFGIGMSADTVWNIYATYGASTKNNNNDEVGGFGLGSKTAFCYQNGQAWTIESRFNGEKFLFMASLDENSLPTLYHASTTETDEPNGVTIRIPILRQDITQVHKSAEKYVPYFPMDLTVTGTEKTEFTKPESLFSSTSWRVRPYKEYGTGATIVMGNVPYPLDGNLLQHMSQYLPFLRSGYGLEVEIETPIGTVDLVPSRDHLKSTEKTINQLTSLCSSLMKEMSVVIQNTYDSFANKWSKTEWAYRMGRSGFKTFLATINQHDVTNALNGQYSVSLKPKSNVNVDVHNIVHYDGEYKKSLNASTFNVDVCENMYVLRNDGVRNIDQVARWYIQDKCFRKTRTGRKARHGHKKGTLLVVNSRLSDDDVLSLLGGIPKTHYLGVASQFSDKAKSLKQKGTENIYRLYNGKTWGARVRLPKESTVYYVVLTRPHGNVRWDCTSLENIRYMCRYIDVDLPTELYGVRSEEVDDFKNRKGWINFEEYVTTMFTAWANKYIDSHTDVLTHARENEYHQWITEFLGNKFINELALKNRDVMRWVEIFKKAVSASSCNEYFFVRVVRDNKALMKKMDTNDKNLLERIENIVTEIKTKYPMLWVMIDLLQADNSYRNKVDEDSLKMVLDYMK